MSSTEIEGWQSRSMVGKILRRQLIEEEEKKETATADDRWQTAV
jgi:hypothetical protein